MNPHYRSSFTLIELLVVIAILAVLATAVVLVLNPSQLLAQGRDSTRLSDLAALQSSLALFQADQWNQSLGTASTTYLSIPDSSPTCQNTGIVPPPGWSYHCSPASTYAKTDGSGWIPLNFTLISSGSPLSKLPIDPVNTTSSGLYYTYTPGGSYAISGMMESQKYLPTAANDQGYDPGRYEAGSDISLIAKSEGLVGWWPLDGSANDMSGNGNQGTWFGSLIGGSHYTQGKVGSAGNFNGSDSYIDLNYNPAIGMGSFSISLWFNSQDNTGVLGNLQFLLNKYHASGSRFDIYLTADGTGLCYYVQGDNGYFGGCPAVVARGAWNYAVLVRDALSGKVSLYLNGSLVSSQSDTSGNIPVTGGFVYGNQDNQRWAKGFGDDLRIYNRALSAAEIAAIYNAQR